jgi:hypothetical protein
MQCIPLCSSFSRLRFNMYLCLVPELNGACEHVKQDELTPSLLYRLYA